jgi:prepilin-type N-terminal cleavage/methylation domain-containing protein
MAAAHFRRGFTLMELLVVISIITLLIALLQPSLRSSREVARRAICGTQIRQVAVAFTTYADDNRVYPGVGGGGYPRITTSPWVNCEVGHHFNGAPADIKTGTLYNYARDPLVYRCPNDDGRNPYFPTYQPQTISYTLPNWWLGRKTDQVIRPPQTILLIESGHSKSQLGYKPDDGLYIPNFLVHDTPTDRHVNESAAVALGDTHVEWRKWNQFSPLATDYFMLPKD